MQKIIVLPLPFMAKIEIINSQTFWLSGNSLNHLGNKESFIVRLGEDLRQSMLAIFNSRWKVSKKV